MNILPVLLFTLAASPLTVANTANKEIPGPPSEAPQEKRQTQQQEQNQGEEMRIQIMNQLEQTDVLETTEDVELPDPKEVRKRAEEAQENLNGVTKKARELIQDQTESSGTFRFATRIRTFARAFWPKIRDFLKF